MLCPSCLRHTHQSKKDKDIVQPKPPLDDQSGVKSQTNNDDDKAYENCIDNKEGITSRCRVVVVGSWPVVDDFDWRESHIDDYETT